MTAPNVGPEQSLRVQRRHRRGTHLRPARRRPGSPVEPQGRRRAGWCSLRRPMRAQLVRTPTAIARAQLPMHIDTRFLGTVREVALGRPPPVRRSRDAPNHATEQVRVGPECAGPVSRRQRRYPKLPWMSSGLDGACFEGSSWRKVGVAGRMRRRSVRHRRARRTMTTCGAGPGCRRQRRAVRWRPGRRPR